MTNDQPDPAAHLRLDARTPEWKETAGNLSIGRMDAKSETPMLQQKTCFCQTLRAEGGIGPCPPCLAREVAELRDQLTRATATIQQLEAKLQQVYAEATAKREAINVASADDYDEGRSDAFGHIMAMIEGPRGQGAERAEAPREHGLASASASDRFCINHNGYSGATIACPTCTKIIK